MYPNEKPSLHFEDVTDIEVNMSRAWFARSLLRLMVLLSEQSLSIRNVMISIDELAGESYL